MTFRLLGLLLLVVAACGELHAQAEPESQGNANKVLTYISGHRMGLYEGVIDGVSGGHLYTGNGWVDEPCFHITVNNEAFESDMYTWPNGVAPYNQDLKIRFLDQSSQWVYATVLGPVASSQGSSGGYATLAVRGTSSPAITSGSWYAIDGKRSKNHATQSGLWGAVNSSGSVTTFTVDEYVVLSDWMVGWLLQPDTSKQVFLPITDVDTWGTVSVRGEYDTLADAGTSYRIHAPPGVETRGAAAGLLEERWVAGRSSRCLYAGYRYEAPLAGLPTWTGASSAASPGAVAWPRSSTPTGVRGRSGG